MVFTSVILSTSDKAQLVTSLNQKFMPLQLYAKRQQVLSIGYQENLVIRVKNLHKKRNFKKCFHPLVIYTTILLK